MLHGLYTLSDHLALESRRHAQYAFQDVQILRILEHIAHEALINLEYAGGQAFEIGQRRIAGAKVIQGKRYPNTVTSVQNLRGLDHVLQCACLQHFNLQAEGFDTWVRRKQFSQAIYKIRLLQLQGRHIHADRHLQTSGIPGLDLRKGTVYHPLAKFDGQQMIFNDREKHARRQQSPYRVLPSNERLDANNLARTHIYFGLVVKDKLMRSKCEANVLKVLMPATHALVVIGIKDVIAVTACQLGLIHSLVGLAQQQIRIHLFGLRIERNTDTCRNTEAKIANLHPFRRSLQQQGQRRYAGFGVIQVQHHRDELVSAQPGKRIAFAQDAFHVEGQRGQQPVPSVMSVLVVDFFEAVEVK